MFIISYSSQLLGGYGDRINGLIAIKILSKIFNHDFYILWNKENVVDLFDYNKYNIRNITNRKIISWNLIDGGRNKMFDYVKAKIKNVDKPYTDNTIKNIFPNPYNAFCLNNNFCRKVGNMVGVKITDEEIISEYEKLYTDILKPTDLFLNKVDNIINGRTNIIGVQIRCGDTYMVTNKKETHNTGRYKNIKKNLMHIKKQCDETMGIEYNVFITSDCDESYIISIQIWNTERVIYNDDIIQHLDRKPINKDISKVFVDAYILSHCTSKLYISENSNYGIVSALACSHNNIYSVDSKKIPKNKLLKIAVI